MAQEPAHSNFPADWNPAPPEKVPAPSIWPAVLSFGVTFLLWGLISSLIVTGVGVAVLAFALGGWIQEIRHDRKK